MIKTNITTYKGLLNTILLNQISDFIKSKKNVNTFYFKSDITYCDVTKKDIVRHFFITIKVNDIEYVLRGMIYDIGKIEFTNLFPQDNSSCIWYKELNSNNFRFK